MDGEELMTYTALNHQGEIMMVWLQFWEALMSSVWILQSRGCRLYVSAFFVGSISIFYMLLWNQEHRRCRSHVSATVKNPLELRRNLCPCSLNLYFDRLHIVTLHPLHINPGESRKAHVVIWDPSDWTMWLNSVVMCVAVLLQKLFLIWQKRDAAPFAAFHLLADCLIFLKV